MDDLNDENIRTRMKHALALFEPPEDGQERLYAAIRGNSNPPKGQDEGGVNESKSMDNHIGYGLELKPVGSAYLASTPGELLALAAGRAGLYPERERGVKRAEM